VRAKWGWANLLKIQLKIRLKFVTELGTTKDIVFEATLKYFMTLTPVPEIQTVTQVSFQVSKGLRRQRLDFKGGFSNRNSIK